MSQPKQAEAASTSSPAQEHAEKEEAKGECPICKMMREGGCEQQFHAFMDCGVAAEKGEQDYAECIKAFEAMRECMTKNPAHFQPMLGAFTEEGEEGAADAAQQPQTQQAAAQ